MYKVELSDQDFRQIQTLLYQIAGISMAPSKKPLVSGRLMKRLRHHHLKSYSEYCRLLSHDSVELQMAIDLLTTNETYFFRESKHFDFLRRTVLPDHNTGKPFRLWSAASSSGEEPYSLAMVLADVLGSKAWEIFASDISTRILERARTGLYAMERAEKIPREYLLRYCLKGTGTQDGKFMIAKELRSRVQYRQINLNESLPDIGRFDVIFLRNVMIYFDMETKRQVVARISALLNPGGHLFIGHSESLNGVTEGMKLVMPSVYRRPLHE